MPADRWLLVPSDYPDGLSDVEVVVLDLILDRAAQNRAQAVQSAARRIRHKLNLAVETARRRVMALEEGSA